MRDYLRLGASLYVPATRSDLPRIADGTLLPGLRSIIFCTEDAVALDQVEAALANLELALPCIERGTTLHFIRVRNPSVMARVLALPGIETIDGFVLPKTTRRSFAAYTELLTQRDRFWLMPTLETSEAFDRREMNRLLKSLQKSPLFDRILALRIGGNDLLNLLGLKRGCETTIYDTPLASVIAMLITVFYPAGLPLTAPVFDRLNSPEILAREVRFDLQYGLVSKSAIHPRQIATIEAHYAVSREELEIARSILRPLSAPVYQLHGCMCEPVTNHRWAETILQRWHMYGLDETEDSVGIALPTATLGEV